jgi:hypothetical protein
MSPTPTPDSHLPPQQESCLAKFLQTTLVIFLIIGAMIWFNPTRITPTAYDPPRMPAVNVSYDLDLAESVFRALRRLKGPESIAIHPTNGFLYSGTQDGKLVRATLEKPFSSFPEALGMIGDPNAALPLPCGTYTTEPICGRPLGMKMVTLNKADPKSTNLFFADAYLGIAQYNTARHELTMLVKPSFTTVDGVKFVKPFFNDVEYDHVDNVLFFTISSTKFGLNDLVFDLLDLGQNGLLCKVDLSSGDISIVTKNIGFANGLVIHPTERTLFVSESTRFRILRIDIDSKKKSSYGKSTIFADNIPLFPDNLAIIGDDELWTAGVNLRVSDITNNVNKSEFPSFFGFSPLDFLAKYPKLRLLISKAIPPQYTSLFSSYETGGIVRFDLNTGKVINLITASKSHKNSSLQGIGRSIASITPHMNPAGLPENQIHVYLGGFTPGTHAIGRITWDLKNKKVLPSTDPRSNDSVRAQYRKQYDGVDGEEQMKEYISTVGM